MTIFLKYWLIVTTKILFLFILKHSLTVWSDLLLKMIVSWRCIQKKVKMSNWLNHKEWITESRIGCKDYKMKWKQLFKGSLETVKRVTLKVVEKTGFCYNTFIPVKLWQRFVKYSGALELKRLSMKCRQIDLRFKLGGTQMTLKFNSLHYTSDLTLAIYLDV